MTKPVLPDDIFSDFQKIERRLERLEAALKPGAVRVIGTTGNPAWSGTFTNYPPPGTFVLCGFYKHAGRVWLQGMAYNASGWAASTVLWTMPPDYWPSNTVLLDTQRSGAIGRIDVLGADASPSGNRGQVREVIGNAGAGWVTLDGLSYRHA